MLSTRKKPRLSCTVMDKVKGSFSILVDGQFIQHINGHNRFKFGVHRYTVIFWKHRARGALEGENLLRLKAGFDCKDFLNRLPLNQFLVPPC